MLKSLRGPTLPRALTLGKACLAFGRAGRSDGIRCRMSRSSIAQCCGHSARRRRCQRYAPPICWINSVSVCACCVQQRRLVQRQALRQPDRVHEVMSGTGKAESRPVRRPSTHCRRSVRPKLVARPDSGQRFSHPRKQPVAATGTRHATRCLPHPSPAWADLTEFP